MAGTEKPNGGNKGRHKGRDYTMDCYKYGDPVRNLWAAVMLRAVVDLRENKDLTKRARWFFTSPQSRFEWICKSLELDMEAIRNKMLQRPRLTLKMMEAK